MPLSALSERNAVLQAMKEYDEIGRDSFLEKHKYGRARGYFVVHDGKRYDSKAIAGVAVGIQFPSEGPLRATDFSGGEATVKAKLEELGFRVEGLGDDGLAAASWAEVTSLEHGHGGPGWELGRCLWSPTASKDGADRYSVMMRPAPGDEVFHLVSGTSAAQPRRRFLYGASRVGRAAVVSETEPPSPGAWAGAGTYYRIDVAQFHELSIKLPMDDVEEGLADLILSDLVSRPKFYPYSPYRDGFRVSQGIYLTRLTPGLADAFRELCGIAAQQGTLAAPDAAREVAFEFAEGERARRESSFFKRNPRLRADAIARYGLRCHVCGFDFESAYGEVGRGYIEIHHLNPLAERADVAAGTPVNTTLDDVRPLCANCHRVVHRRRPALSIERLQSALRR
jgi:hypothetical protein